MPTNPDREKELVKRAQKGEAYAFETLLNEYYMTIYKMAYKYIQQKEAAEDITQNVCLKLARALDSYKHNARFTSWLFRIVINTAKDWQRSQYRHTAHTDELTENVDNIKSTNSLSTQENATYTQQVMNEINNLSTKERDALILVTIEGMNHALAAEHMNCSEGTISWRVHEARKKLKERLGE